MAFVWIRLFITFPLLPEPIRNKGFSQMLLMALKWWAGRRVISFSLAVCSSFLFFVNFLRFIVALCVFSIQSIVVSKAVADVAIYRSYLYMQIHIVSRSPLRMFIVIFFFICSRGLPSNWDKRHQTSNVNIAMRWKHLNGCSYSFWFYIARDGYVSQQ